MGGVFSYLTIILLVVICGFSFFLVTIYESIQSIIEVINTIFMTFGFLLIYAGFWANIYKDVKQIEERIPSWLPYTISGIGVFVVIVSYLGFYFVYQEKPKHIRNYSILNLVVAILVLILSILIVADKNILYDYILDNCYTLMNVFDMNNYDKFDCSSKYLSSSLGSIFPTATPCEKDLTKVYWEESMSSQVNFGCLNGGCCKGMASWIDRKLDYLALFGFVTAAFASLFCIGGWFMVK